MRTFEFRDGSSNKFWSIDLQGKGFTVRFGKIGTTGQTQVKEFADEEKAQKEYDKLIREKTGKGYVEVTAGEPGRVSAGSSALRRELERQLGENFDDLATHSAYADLLTEEGDPRGEFVSVQLALEKPGLPAAERNRLKQREKELLDAHQRDWLGGAAEAFLNPESVETLEYPSPDTVKFTFARGWLESLRFGEFNSELASALARCPAARLLRRLAICGADYDNEGYDELARAPGLESLVYFQLGPKDQCHISGEGILPALRRMKHLVELQLLAHRVPVKETFALPWPHLRRLTVHHLHEYPLEVLGRNSTISNLEYLSCWPHGLEPGDPGAYITAESACAFVRSPHLKSLRHLALYLTDLGDEGVHAIIASGLLKKLKVLDLWSGRISDEGARALAACPDLKNLEKLRVAQNILTRAGVAALRATGVKLEAEGQLTAAQLVDGAHLWEGDPE
jgi:uncharacterized protein (TIGR02996 family)